MIGLLITAYLLGVVLTMFGVAHELVNEPGRHFRDRGIRMAWVGVFSYVCALVWPFLAVGYMIGIGVRRPK